MKVVISEKAAARLEAIRRRNPANPVLARVAALQRPAPPPVGVHVAAPAAPKPPRVVVRNNPVPLPILVRPVACAELGSCPAGRRCSEGYRTCGAGHGGAGGVRHAETCQTCDDYVAKENGP